jgi:hypothetical protein
LYFLSKANDNPTGYFAPFSFAMTGLAGLAQWYFFRPRLEAWWIPVQAAAGFVLGYVQKYIYDNVSGWYEIHMGLLVAAWIVVSLAVGLILLQNPLPAERASPIVTSGARQNRFLLLASITLLLAAVSNFLLVREMYDPLDIAWRLYALAAFVTGVSLFFVKSIPRNFGFISLAIFLILDSILVIQLAFELNPPGYFFTINALTAFAAAFFFLAQRETWRDAGFLLLSGHLLMNALSGVYVYDWEINRAFLTIASFLAVPAALVFLLRKS